jgi:CubicO group peptidase (beta-lactamase class C family)
MTRLSSLSCLAVATAALHAQTFEWQTAKPESQGMSTARLDEMRAGLAAHHTKILLVVRNDRIVYEWYAPDFGPDKRHYTASMAKAMIGGVALAVAMTDGRIRLDDPASKYVPSWDSDARKSRITVRHLGSHTSGLADAKGEQAHEKLPGWMGEFWRREPVPRDPFTISRDVTPVVFDPGDRNLYSNPGIAMFGWCITASLRGTAHRDLRTLLRERVMRPIGVKDSDWSCGYDQTVEVDGLPHVAAWGGASFNARAAARVGRLLLREGDWDGKPLISAEAVRATTRDAGTPGSCGMGWWANEEGALGQLPRDAYAGLGAQNQTIVVVPSLKLIAVRHGGALSDERGAAGKYLFNPLAAAVIK